MIQIPGEGVDGESSCRDGFRSAGPSFGFHDVDEWNQRRAWWRENGIGAHARRFGEARWLAARGGAQCGHNGNSALEIADHWFSTLEPTRSKRLQELYEIPLLCR
jgi:hypothetical protein